MKANYVSTANNYRSESRLEVNSKKGKGPLVHMKTHKGCKDDLFLLENPLKEPLLKIDSEGEVFVKGKKITSTEPASSEIVLGSWKLVADNDNLLIQKLINNEWVTKQHFN